MTPDDAQPPAGDGESEKQSPIRRKFSLFLGSGRKLKEWFKFIVGSLFWIAIATFGTRHLLDMSHRYFPIVLHLLFVSIWALLIAGWVWMLTGERVKDLFRASYVNGILWPPFFYSITLFVISAPVFASISVTLQQYGFTTFEPPLPEELSPVVNFYVWHFLDSVPGLEIPQTLKWDQPYQYSDRLSGVVLLVFKITVIVPVIASFVLWKGVRESAVAARALKEQRKPRKKSRKPAV